MKYVIYFFFINSLCLINLNAQGCSDAGVCSISNSFSNTIENSKNQIEAGSVFGIGEAAIFYISPYVTYTRHFSETLSISAKVTYSQANGDFGTRGQFGDAYLLGNYNFKKKKETQWNALLGFKFPFTTANAKINEISLPLDYQASLGTFDAIIGVGLTYKKWLFHTALQLPVFNNNKNSYFDEYSASNDFQSTNLFERKPDFLLRTTYTIVANEKLTFKPNLLFLYHLGNDSYETIFGTREVIKGSEGVTLNANLITSYAFTTNKSIELSLATPFVVRDVRPDGLTRSFTAGISYIYGF